MNKAFLPLIIIYFFLHIRLFAQTNNITVAPVDGIPTKIIFDLFQDRQNFLWLATETGVYRYDGISFTLFSSPEQSSLSVSGLTQDAEGKIWFQNFNGQILYIEHEKTYLLKSYDSQSESIFPRIVIYKGNLIATSDRGLFICNTRTLSSRYESLVDLRSSATTSLAVIADKIVAYGYGKWFTYQPGQKLKPANADRRLIYSQQEAISLHTNAIRDTVFMFSNPSGTLDEIGIRNDSIVLFRKRTFKDFINTVSITDQKVWINTVKTSTQPGKKLKLSGYNISDVVTDQEGNTWFSSLDKGLLVDFKRLSRQNIKLPDDGEGDYVRTMIRHGKLLLLGTDKGKLYLYDYIRKRFLKDVNLPGNFNSVHKIAFVGHNEFLIGTAINTYKINLDTGYLELMPAIKILKQTDYTKDLLFTTTAGGLIITLKRKSEKLKKEVINQFKGIVTYNLATNSFIYPKRCSAISYYPKGNSLFVGFKNGLYKIDNKGLTPVMFNGKLVYTLFLAHHNGKIYIGTINNGILVYDNDSIQKFSIKNGLLSENIVSIKQTGNKLWILSSGAVQMFDMDKSEFHSGGGLSTLESIMTNDLLQIENNVYLATQTGLFMIPLLQNKSMVKLADPILSVLVNNKISNTLNHFQHGQNNLHFKIGVPLYFNAKQTYIRYSLKTENDSSWNMTGPGERNVTFASLMPGKYIFNAIAINPELGKVSKPVIYKFEILHSWWQNEYFQKAIISLFLLFIIYILVNYHLNNRNFKVILYRQEQSIRQERQRISSEIHDDIGAGIFAIKLFADVSTKNNTKADDIVQIALMINDMSQKIREIIWSTNVENDNLEDLIWYLKDQTVKLFEHSTITFTWSVPEYIPQISVIGEDRKNIHLLVKEFIHNAIKHSRASEIALKIQISDKFIHIEITDNGVGFNTRLIRQDAMGLKNAQLRIKKLHGKYEVLFNSGTSVHVQIPMIYFANPLGESM